MTDAYFWLDAPETGHLQAELQAVVEGSRQTLAEFEKVDSIRRETTRALQQAQLAQQALTTDIASTLWRKPEDFVQALGRLRERHAAACSPLRSYATPMCRRSRPWTAPCRRCNRRWANAPWPSWPTSTFDGHQKALVESAAELERAATSPALARLLEGLDAQAAGLDLLTEQLGGLPGGDAVVRTAILDRISGLYGEINRQRAQARNRKKNLEGVGRSRGGVRGPVQAVRASGGERAGVCRHTRKCDETLTRLLAQLEELEGRFAEHEQFLSDVAEKREAVVDALSARRQTLVEARQRQAATVGDAATRILDGIPAVWLTSTMWRRSTAISLAIRCWRNCAS
ncbi:MAG: hypothetical protein R3E42_15980 [Burkholderiaceae bacterium]